MKKHLRRLKIILVIIALGGLYYGLTHLPLLEPYLNNPELLKTTILRFGILAPLAVILLQAFQTTISIIPSQLTTIIAGFLFGPLWGLIYSIIGAFFGSATIFLISRKYGTRLALHLFEKSDISHFHHLFQQKKSSALLLARITPLFPNDLVSFGAGLTNINFWRFNLFSTIGFAVQMTILSYFGSELAQGTISIPLILISIAVSLLFLIVIFKHQMKTIFIRNFHKLEHIPHKDIKKLKP